jgi:hypothetical protein
MSNSDDTDMSDFPAPGTIEHLKRSLIFTARNPWQAHIGQHRGDPESTQDESQMSLLDHATRDYIGLERRFAGNTIQMVTATSERDQALSQLDQVISERNQVTAEHDMLYEMLTQAGHTPASIQNFAPGAQCLNVKQYFNPAVPAVPSLPELSHSFTNLAVRPGQEALTSAPAPAPAKDVKTTSCRTDCWRERAGKPCQKSSCGYWHEYQTARWETIRSTLPANRVVPAARPQADADEDAQDLLDAMGD